MKPILIAVAVCIAVTTRGQKTIPLYSGSAPGSENWNWSEQEFKVENNTYVVDISRPSLLAYLPSRPNGTSIIIAPGGAFHALALDIEATPLAKRLNEKGISVFVLKYRLVHDDPAHPENALMKLIAKNDLKKIDSIYSRIVPMATQDGLTAVNYIRRHATEYHLDSSKIGFMGFSSGGRVAMSVIYHATKDTRPDFVAPVYGFVGGLENATVPSVRTPIFIAVASDDDFGFAPANVALYLKWQKAKQPAELHVYEKGGHGFGLKKQDLPVDTWIDRFEDWLRMQGYLSH